MGDVACELDISVWRGELGERGSKGMAVGGIDRIREGSQLGSYAEEVHCDVGRFNAWIIISVEISPWNAN